jgi:hypothetical protein
MKNKNKGVVFLFKEGAKAKKLNKRGDGGFTKVFRATRGSLEASLARKFGYRVPVTRGLP